MVLDVRVTDDLAGLAVQPRHRDDVLPVLAALRERCSARRGRGVVIVPGHEAARLSDGLPPFELRWSEEALQYAANRRDLEGRLGRLRFVLEELTGQSRATLEGCVPHIEDIARLDDHQVRNVAIMTRPECFGLCLFDEQGAGKTVSVIYAWDELVGQDVVDFALILAPKSMVPEWARDFERFRPGLYSVGLATGDRAAKRAALRRGTDVVISNFETASQLEHELVAHLRQLDGRSLLVVDESYFVKNDSAQRTRAVRRLREWCGRAFVLCGTPAPNAAHDVVEQFNIADFGAAFVSTEVPADRDAAHKVVGDVLRRRAVYLRSLKHEVLPELPRKRFDVVRLPLAPAQAQAYEAALKNLILDLDSLHDDAFLRQLTSYMARRATLLQICSNPARLINGYDETPSKLRALDDIVSVYAVDRHEKLVIWSSYRASIEAISARYADVGLVRYDGSVTDVAERRRAVTRFQEDPGTRIFVGNPAAAGAGLTLHAARFAVYESLTNQAAHYLQSLDRIHRRGQRSHVRYIVLLADGTIEETEYATLQAKERAAQDLLGDPPKPPPTRQGLLSELLASAERLGLNVT